MSKKASAFEQKTSLLTGDWFPFVRLTESDTSLQNCIIEKTNLDTYINNLISTSVKTYTDGGTITNTNSQSYALGAVATYEGFSIKAIIGLSTSRYIVNIDFAYNASTPEAYTIAISSRITGLTIDASVSLGQFYMRLTNNTGSTISIKYRITEQLPAI